MHRITKHIDFCYGHRLLHYEGKCRHPHGHNGRLEITFQAECLDPRGMVFDFAEIKRAVKGWIDAELDHRMILHRDDPLAAWLAGQGEPCHLLDENPTAENIAKMVYRRVEAGGWPVLKVRLWETPDSWAEYGDYLPSAER